MLFTVHNLRASRNEFVIDTVVEIKYLYIAMCLLSNFYPYINQKKCGGHFAYLFDNRKMKANKNLSCAGNLFTFFGFHLCMFLHYIMYKIKQPMPAPFPSLARKQS